MKEMVKIPLEILIGNVFIQALEEGITYVPFSIIEDYAREIQNKRNVYFYFSRDEIRKAIDENFELCNKGIKCNISIEELKEKHLGWLPVDLAIIFSETKISF